MNNDINEMFKREVISALETHPLDDSLFDTAHQELNQYEWYHSSDMYEIIEKYYDTIDYGELTHEIIDLHIGFGTYDDYTNMLSRVMEEYRSPKATKMAMLHHYILMYCFDLKDLDEYKTQVLSEIVDVFFENNEYDKDESINKIVDDAENYFDCEICETCWETNTLYELIVEKQNNQKDKPEDNEPVDH